MKIIVKSLVLSGVVALNTACPTGLDYSTMAFDEKYFTNMGLQASQGNDAGLDAYALLRKGSSGGSSAGVSMLRDQLGVAYQAVQSIKNLHEKATLQDTQRAALDNWSKDFRKDILDKGIAPKIDPAGASSSGAKALAGALSPLVKENGTLSVKLADANAQVPQDAKGTFATYSDQLTLSMETLYQYAVVLASSTVQGKAEKYAAEVKTALNQMLDKLENGAIADDTKRDLARSSLDRAITNLNTLIYYIGNITSRDLVARKASTAVADLKTNQGFLKTRLVDETETTQRAVMRNADLSAKNAIGELESLFTDYATTEGIKSESDTKLKTLVSQAFGSAVPPAIAGAAELTRTTDLNELVLRLAKNQEVVMQGQDDYLAKALAHAVVVNHSAKGMGLFSENVWGLNVDELHKTKEEFGMNDDDFAKFVNRQAEVGLEELSKDSEGDSYSMVLSIDGNKLGVSNTQKVADHFSSEKVLIIAKDPSEFDRAKRFTPRGLNVAEGLVVANAIIRADEVDFNPSILSVPLVKAFAAFGNRGEMTVGNLRKVVKDALSRLPSYRPSSAEAQQFAMDALAANTNISTAAVFASNIMAQSVQTVARNVDSQPDYYLQPGRAASNDLAQRLAQSLALNQANQLSIAEENARRDANAAIDAKYNAYKAVLDGVGDFNARSTKITQYRGLVSATYDNYIGLIDSYVNLIDSPLCSFEPLNNGYYDAGWGDFFERVVKKQFLGPVIKNPMSLFDITDSSITPQAGLNENQKAAISLNCFLTAPGRNILDIDGSFTLKTKLVEVKQRMLAIKSDAHTIASNANGLNLGGVGANINELLKRINNVDPARWENRIEKDDPLFKVDDYLRKIPNMGGVADATRNNLASNEFALLPARAGGPFIDAGQKNLPTNFFATKIAPYYNAGGAHGVFNQANNYYSAPWVSNFLGNWQPPLGAPTFWSISNAYGQTVNNGIVAQMALPLPAELNNNNWQGPTTLDTANFHKLNKRLHAWVFGRIAGKRMFDVFGTPDLFVNQGGTDYFDGDHVFINYMHNETKAFAIDLNRSLIAAKALLVLEQYREMFKLLYRLDPGDFKDIEDQAAGASVFGDFFRAVKTVLSDSAIANAQVGTVANLGAAGWSGHFFPLAITDVLPAIALAAGNPGFLAAPPPVGANVTNADQKLAGQWAALRTAALEIERLYNEITVAGHIQKEADIAAVPALP